jgi:hypothetical protein
LILVQCLSDPPLADYVWRPNDQLPC